MTASVIKPCYCDYSSYYRRSPEPSKVYILRTTIESDISTDGYNFTISSLNRHNDTIAFTPRQSSKHASGAKNRITGLTFGHEERAMRAAGTRYVMLGI